MVKENQLQVEAIRNGSVIDHIPANLGIKILSLFKLHETNQRITIGLNLPSSALGHKDLIKIENIYLSKEQANQLALYAPNATVNQIEEYQVVNKLTLTLPERIDGVFACPNSNCISHGEPVSSRFRVILKQENVQLKCHYCEKVFSREIMTEN
ncbi:aspartate carbamoyltransferase regulatory subunit [Vibrio fluvialis]|jgi:aspartate carbamoyltransferase regulatory subunit|uniref:Aspartate carbamoyltransferase regulatory chain n=2 Tax=Vibrio fluvialis TaxID=676 RepID=A0AAX2LMK7_VIBFL|nr:MULTISPECIES: aspartate carbamoyltransferase regulatory subunit [Vibrio]TNF12614.1 MAG: aspartate carbamoyltransferase regulatory subunit [Vibrionaceae bacterium]HDM8034952.1 aspartate carbamoyltransferase regulatory subunit [Vibrio fluvialis clinical-1]AMF95904.1 aspartate carbamoyltransferase regulatory subunit [Vibrio fluvialis]AVH31865.1 aspartate carbamoyltransferase regulatory subunit [Vibrio fluvialis]EKO3369073.1 aspartate carbamoyltransferase regulatory subunit [Vibrio fluvialis]